MAAWAVLHGSVSVKETRLPLSVTPVSRVTDVGKTGSVVLQRAVHNLTGTGVHPLREKSFKTNCAPGEDVTAERRAAL
ncbi:hypothetical protein INR49_003276 [Caranx melampygus]|nr:hypothetical protein INR49_003276 [Caranx melampygus]